MVNMSVGFREARTKQHDHGVKGAASGHCREAQEGGIRGGSFGERGGAPGKSKTKPPPIRMTFQIVELYRSYQTLLDMPCMFRDWGSSGDA